MTLSTGVVASQLESAESGAEKVKGLGFEGQDERVPDQTGQIKLFVFLFFFFFFSGCMVNHTYITVIATVIVTTIITITIVFVSVRASHKGLECVVLTEYFYLAYRGYPNCQYG